MGFSALKILGSFRILITPIAASVKNQTIITGAEQCADRGGAFALKGKEADHDRHGKRNDIWLEQGRGDLKPFDGAEHRNGWRNDSVSIKKCSAKYADQGKPCSQFWMVTHRPNCQCNERHDAAFAFVVGTHDEDDIFHRYDNHQRPENRRDTAQHVRRGERYAV